MFTPAFRRRSVMPVEASSGSPAWRRREFLGRVILAAGAVALASPLELLADNAAGGDPIPKRHRAVDHFIRRYSRRYWVGGPGRERTRILRILVRIDDMSRLSTALADLPFTRVLAGGNTLSFQHRGLAVVIENVMPHEFSSRIRKIRATGVTKDIGAPRSFGTTF